jgi:hypothetical protein
VTPGLEERRDAEDASQRRPSKLALAVRLALVGCLLWAALSSARSIQRWLTPAQRSAAETDASPQALTNPAHALLAGAQERGTWTLAGIPWQVRVEFCDSAAAARRWTDPQALPSPDPASPGIDAKRFAPLLAQLGAGTKGAAQGGAYRVDADDWKLGAQVRRQAQREEIVSLRLAARQGPERWRLFAFSPQPPRDGPEAPEGNDLLPLDGDVRRLACRHAEDNVLQCQLLQVERSAEELVADCRKAGWTVHRSEPSEERELQSWLCEGKDYCVQAWRWRAGALHNLLLVRLERAGL